MSPPKRPLLSWLNNEGRHPSRVRSGDRSLRVRQRVPDTLNEARAPRRDLLELPPVLHGQAEAAGHGRSGRALPAPPREGRPQGLAAHVSPYRWAGRPRGRDDARPFELGRRGPEAERADRRGLPPDRFGDEAALVLPAAGRPRR